MRLGFGIGLGLVLALTALVAYVSLGLGFARGSLGFDGAWPALLWGSGLERDILLSIRLPRVLAALIVGAALASAGMTLQTVSRNPLADPYLLGISGGAALAVVLVHGVLGLSQTFGWWVVPVAGFLGAQAATLVVLALARGPAGRVTILGIVLGGVVINALCAAVTTFLMVRFDPYRLRITTLWMAGSLSSETYARLGLAALAAAMALGYLVMRSRLLSAFALGEEGAAGVGVDTDRELRLAAIASSVLAGVGVSLAGLLGYLGLVVPHLVRLRVGLDVRKGLLLSAAVGGLLLLLADSAARVVAAPAEMPVGVLAALAGCPVLLLLLRNELRR